MNIITSFPKLVQSALPEVKAYISIQFTLQTNSARKIYLQPRMEILINGINE